MLFSIFPLALPLVPHTHPSPATYQVDMAYLAVVMPMLAALALIVSAATDTTEVRVVRGPTEAHADTHQVDGELAKGDTHIKYLWSKVSARIPSTSPCTTNHPMMVINAI